MNEILQKRIEEAAKKQSNKYGHSLYVLGHFKDGANFVLNNLWISVEEGLPEYQQDVVVSDGLEYWMSWRTQETDAAHKDNNDFINYSTLEIKYWMSVPQLFG